MMVIKCDLCGKVLKDQKRVTAGSPYVFSTHEFCFDCGKPIFNFLKKNGFLKNETKKKIK